MVRVNIVALILLSLFAIGWADDAKKDVETHLGTWRMVAVVSEGKEDVIASSTFGIFTNDGYSITVNGKPYQKGSIKADRTKSPVESDVTITEGQWAGGTVLHISKVEGDVMIQCFGTERPTEFKSKPGSGHTLIVWVRAK